MRWSSRKLLFECQKISKNLTFFNKIANGNFVEKNDNFFQKNVKFVAIFWHSNDNFPEGQMMIHHTMYQGCQIWHPSWVRAVRVAPIGTNLGPFKIIFIRVWLADKKKCTETDLKKSKICPIWNQSDTNWSHPYHPWWSPSATSSGFC